MAKVDLIMPKMGESIMEATILKWSKSVGDHVELDETVLEIATDKVDSEIPSPVAGKLVEIKYAENDVVEVGKVIAIIATEGEEESPNASPAIKKSASSNGNGIGDSDTQEHVKKDDSVKKVEKPEAQPQVAHTTISTMSSISPQPGESNRFYSPLVKNIAKTEQISLEELDSIKGSGLNGRVTKRDIEQYLANRGQPGQKPQSPPSEKQKPETIPDNKKVDLTEQKTVKEAGPNEEIIQMDRMRKLIAEHMVRSKQTSAHVTSFVEVDVTEIVNWRNKIKEQFQKDHGEKITYTPIFIQAIAKAIVDFPFINITVDGDQIIKKKDINIGMAAALPSGNLIVPVIQNADYFNLVGLTKKVNDLANRARQNQLKPEEIQGGTFTLTNVGTFGNVMGTPIINQPQVAIMAAGAIRKKPAVMETSFGDVIAVRHMMYLSLSYDHRVVDGFLGGSFLSKVGYYLEHFDISQQ